jgi:hypothetical protein
VKNAVLPHGASSKKKPFSLRAIFFKIPMAIHPRSSERGILAFSRNHQDQCLHADNERERNRIVQKTLVDRFSSSHFSRFQRWLWVPGR